MRMQGRSLSGLLLGRACKLMVLLDASGAFFLRRVLIWCGNSALRKVCSFGQLSRVSAEDEVRGSRITREQREGLYESSRVVNMVDGLPRAPGLQIYPYGKGYL